MSPADPACTHCVPSLFSSKTAKVGSKRHWDEERFQRAKRRMVQNTETDTVKETEAVWDG